MDKEKKSRYSLNDLAQMLGVSKATVSRALSGSKGVGIELRERVLQLADEVGYHPNTLAQSLAKGRLNIIALILGDIRNPFYAELAFNIQQLLDQHGYMLMVLNSEYDPDKELNYLQMVSQFNFAGLFLLTAHSPAVEEALHALDAPVVLVNRTLPSYNGSHVLLDNFQAGYLAAMHLIELNHQRIGFICGPRTSSASYQRYLGYRQAISNFNVCDVEAYYEESDLTMQTGHQLAKKFMDNKAPKPSAMIVSNDTTAIGFMNGLKEVGLQIPDDLSIVSFDNIPFASAVGIDLTTVDQHVDEICNEAARIMLKQLRIPDAETEKVIITPTLVTRKTTKAYAGGTNSV